jgi:hypothetical protein
MGSMISCTEHRKPHKVAPRNHRNTHQAAPRKHHRKANIAPLPRCRAEMDFNGYRYDKAIFLANMDYQPQLLSDLKCEFEDPLPTPLRLPPRALAPTRGLISCCECSLEYSGRVRRCPNPQCGHCRCWFCKETVLYNRGTGCYTHVAYGRF